MTGGAGLSTLRQSSVGIAGAPHLGVVSAMEQELCAVLQRMDGGRKVCLGGRVFLRISGHRGRLFQPIVDGISDERGRRFRLIVDDVSA